MRKILIFLLLCSITFADNPYRSYANFNAGELYLLDGREDLAKYQSGCSIMENVIPIPQGGAQKRPGTKYIAEVKTSSLATRILPFEFSTSQSYVIEVGNQYLRFFANGARIFEDVGTEDLSDFDSATGDSSLIAHWKCEESSGAGAGDVTDDTVAGTHDGTPSANISNFTTTDKAGTANSAFDLDGQYYVTVGDHIDFEFGDSSDDSPFSIAAWVNLISSASDQTILSKYDGESGARKEWQLQVNSDDKIKFEIYDESGNDAAITLASITTGWHFIVVTYDGRGGSDAADGMKIYLDWLFQALL